MNEPFAEREPDEERLQDRIDGLRFRYKQAVARLEQLQHRSTFGADAWGEERLLYCQGCQLYSWHPTPWSPGVPAYRPCAICGLDVIETTGNESRRRAAPRYVCPACGHIDAPEERTTVTLDELEGETVAGGACSQCGWGAHLALIAGYVWPDGLPVGERSEENWSGIVAWPAGIPDMEAIP